MFAFWTASGLAQDVAPLRPPAVPLIAHDPYFSVWSTADRLTDAPTKHWTGSEQPITGIAQVDGKLLRFMGGRLLWAVPVPAMKQVELRLTPTRTLYAFEGGGVRIDFTLLTPALPDDLEVLSRPVTYLDWEVKSIDGKAHEVRLYLDCSSHLVVNLPQQHAAWSRHQIGSMQVLRLGSTEQKMLAVSGDDLRIDWGYLYLAVPAGHGKSRTFGATTRRRALHLANMDFPETNDLEQPRQTDRDVPLVGVILDLGAVGADAVRRHLMIAYDDLYSVEYFERRLRPYWRRNRRGPEWLLATAAEQYEGLRNRCIRFDQEITRDLVAAGGPRFAALAILAYRQTLAAHKLAADFDGTPLYFSKENRSNGCIGTVDVTYPSAPFFLLLNPRLLEAQLRPVLEYARSGRWPWPYAPHDLGQYPLANGQVYGGGEESEERQMPVEESGNMLILMAALAKAEGNAEFSRRYWPLLTRWAEYLKEKGMDPENQLSTDDFAGHLAHNTNLSLKAIMALASYAQLARQLGQAPAAREYDRIARDMAGRWTRMAADGDHYRLAFDKPGTWSQKYNLVWDKLLGFGLFPPEVAQKEIAFYKARQKRYGLPLDNRADYTKLDWIVWTATLSDNARDFSALVDPVYAFANESSSRVPLTDWYWTTDGTQRGFQARSVVGGVFIKLLENGETWKRWAARGK
ncbi:MAG: DUF4965 domain-containing protein [Acidobacteria bacterium]|nr:DUF4965 domain-containing protein [Acidobacteriota bacterium]MBI3280667.1 DUF4965 domain-containing protein [Acidobacteriota bacterium]